MSETEKNEDEAVRIARDHIDKAERNIHPDRCASCTMARALIAAHEREVELRAALGEACRLLGSSGRHAYPLDCWRRLAEGGK